ncbi:MAG: CBS domain-containing protein [Polyangiales bacterium]
MRFAHPERDESLELALEDVFLLPDYFDGVSRLDVSLAPDDFRGGSQPIVSANMNAVTGKRMAETMARLGGLGVLPQDMRMETVERIVGHIRGAHPRFDTPLTVAPDATLRDVLGLLRKRSHGMVVVVDEARHPLGVVTSADLEGATALPVSRVMSTDMVTLTADVSNADAYGVMHHARVKAAPVLDEAGCLVGILGREDPVRAELLRPSVDEHDKLLVAPRSASARARWSARSRWWTSA